MPEEAIVFLATITLVGGILLLWPVARALAERIRPRADLGAGVRDELQGLREDVVSELRDMRREVAELSERVDFAERLLAKPPH